MTTTEFAFWLNGFLEISDDNDQALSAHQVQIIKDHLALVFRKETPVYKTSTEVEYVPLPYITPHGGYQQDTGGIRLTDFKLPTYGDRIQNTVVNSDPDNLLKDIYIESGPQNPENWKNGHSYKWDEVRKVWTVDINPNTPVEITQTNDYVKWIGPQVTC